MDHIDPAPNAAGSDPAKDAAGGGGKTFISYASQDMAVADKLCAALESSGLKCWIAPRDVRAGESYAAAIVHAINVCRALVLVLSKSASESTHVLREVERASSKKRRVLVVHMDAAGLPPDLEYFLSANQWLDASHAPLEQILPALIASVRGSGHGVGDFLDQGAAAGTIGHASTPASPAPFSPSKRRSRFGTRAWVLAAGSVGLGALLAMLWWQKRGLPQLPASTVQLPASTVQLPASTVQLPAATAPAAAINEKSIAVLPFTDMSEKKDQEYFSDGLSEELIDLLTKITELRVPARTSSFYFKGKSEDIPSIARRLMVAHVLEGSVRKAGNHMRVTAQLVRADNGYHLWSETYDRNLDDIFKVQDDIAGAVVKALKVSLLQTDAPRVAPTASSEAYTLYLRATSLAKREATADTIQAHQNLQQALRLDPKFALAWAALAEIYTDDTVNWDVVFDPKTKTLTGEGRGARPYSDGLSPDWESASKAVVTGAHDAADRALEFGPGLPEAHLAMARVRLFVDWDWNAAESEINKARALDPHNARVTQLAATWAITVGHLPQAIDFANKAIAEDPLGTAHYELAKASYFMGALPQAADAYRQLIELYPTASANRFRYAIVLMALGKPQAAYEEMTGDIPPYRQAGLPLTLDALGRHAEADRELAVAEQKWGAGMAYQISYVYASRHDPDRAIYWLERAFKQHDAGMLSMLHDPMFKDIERRAQFQSLLRKMKLIK